jgi:hypothetical protein
MIGDEIITSEEVSVSELVHEWIEDGPVSDMEVPYPVFIRIYRKGGRVYLDEILDAPWQIGGNSGQVRLLRPLSEEEYKFLRDKK